MGKLTINLDDETEKIVHRYVGKSSTAAGKWIAEAVRRRVAGEWPPDVLKLFGSWKAEAFPEAPELRDGYGPDARREAL